MSKTGSWHSISKVIRQGHLIILFLLNSVTSTMLEMTPRSLFYLIYFQKQGKSETGSWPSISKVIRQGHVNNFIFIEFSDLENVRNDTKITSLFCLHPEIRTNRDFDMVQWRHAWRHARGQPIFIRMLSTRTKIVLWTLTNKLAPKTKLLHQFEMTEYINTGLAPH